MAYYNINDDLDEEQIAQQDQAPVATGNQSATVGSDGGQAPSAAAASAGGAAQGRSAASSAPTFAGINDYLNANKTQAEKLGQQVSGSVAGIADTARQNIGGLGTAAQSQIQGPQKVQDDVFNTVQSGAENLTQAQKDQIKASSTAQYSGPQDYTQLGDTYTNAAKSAKDAQSALQNTQTEQGRVDLLSQVGGGKRNQYIRCGVIVCWLWSSETRRCS
jgi:hypothetical protein